VTPCLVLKYIYRKKDKESRMKGAKRLGFTETFKVQIVREVEEGKITQGEASRRYGILGHSTIMKLPAASSGVSR
jgi:hypothetical protein